MQDMRQQMRGMMGGRIMGGGMVQRHLELLTQQLGLSDDQRTQVQTLIRNHAKEVIRLQADVAIMRIDVGQLLDADSVDLPKVKQLVQAIAAKEADLRLSHITGMQEIRKLLNPEQQKTFRTMQGHMMEDGGMMGHGGMVGPGGMMEGMRGHQGMMGRGMRGHGSRTR
jgi:Spy/CpxP family protein refolding chaperone